MGVGDAAVPKPRELHSQNLCQVQESLNSGCRRVRKVLIRQSGMECASG